MDLFAKYSAAGLELDEQATDQPLYITIETDDSEEKVKWCQQQLAMAAMACRPVPCLYLNNCFSMFDVTQTCIVLKSGLQLTHLKTVQLLRVEGYSGSNIEVAIGELLRLLQTCEILEEIRFVGGGYLLPLSVPAELIPRALKTRNIKVSYERDRGHGVAYNLNWDDGQWQHQVTADESEPVQCIIQQGELDQQWEVKELVVLSTAGVAITQLILRESFENIADDAQSIHLKSGCSVPVLQKLQKLSIGSADFDLEAFHRVLVYTVNCVAIRELELPGCTVPAEVDPGMIPPLLIQRGVQVSWWPSLDSLVAKVLDVDTGVWTVIYDPSREEDRISLSSIGQGIGECAHLCCPGCVDPPDERPSRTEVPVSQRMLRGAAMFATVAMFNDSWPESEEDDGNDFAMRTFQDIGGDGSESESCEGTGGEGSDSSCSQ